MRQRVFRMFYKFNIESKDLYDLFNAKTVRAKNNIQKCTFVFIRKYGKNIKTQARIEQVISLEDRIELNRINDRLLDLVSGRISFKY